MCRAAVFLIAHNMHITESNGVVVHKESVNKTRDDAKCGVVNIRGVRKVT